MALISIPKVLAVSALHSGSDDCPFIYMQHEFHLKDEILLHVVNSIVCEFM